MALDARRRSSIHSKLIPLLGEHDADAFMSEFASVEADGVVNARIAGDGSAELRAECAALRAEFAVLRTDLTWRLIAVVATWTVVLIPLIAID